MNTVRRGVSIIAAIFLTLLVGCGGSDSKDSGYSGVTADAVPSQDNKDDLAMASTLAARKVIAGEGGSGIFGGGAQGNSSTDQMVMDLKSRSFNSEGMPSGVDYSEVCTGGGSASFSGNESKATMSFSNCVIEGITYSGTAIVTSTATSFSIVYQNFRVTYDGITETLNMTISCDDNFDCTYSSDFAEDGRSYRVENSSVSGDDIDGYDVSATVYDEEYGKVTFTSTGLLFDCDNGYPSQGSITMTADGETVSVTFDSCTSYTVTYDGVSDSYTW